MSRCDCVVFTVYGYYKFSMKIRNKFSEFGFCRYSLCYKNIICCCFLDLHLQISWNQTLYLRSRSTLGHALPKVTLYLRSRTIFVTLFSCCFCLERPSLICLFHFTKKCVSSISIYLLNVALSLPLSLSISLFVFLFLSPKVPLLLHLMQIYGCFRPCCI